MRKTLTQITDLTSSPKKTSTAWMAAGLIGFALLSGLPAEAKLVSQDVDYQHQGQAMLGYLVYDDAKAKPGKTPGILVYHAWMGISNHERQWANQLAELGYIAFAPDIYGRSVRPNTPETAGQEAGKYRSDRTLMRARALAGLERLRREPMLDPGRVGAIGFCFGGGVALELARSGADIQGVVSLHGNLDTPQPADAKQIKGAVLVLHGADDPFVKDEQVHGFVMEMRAAGVDWQLNAYGGAVHAFTDPQAGNDPKTGAAYHPKLAKRAWQDTTRFFANLFGV